MWKAFCETRLPPMRTEATTRQEAPRRLFHRLRLIRVIAITIAAIAFCGYLDSVPQAFDYFEQKTYSERMEISAKVGGPEAQAAAAQIVLVTLSDSDYDWANSGHPRRPFISRRLQARLVRELTRYGAKVVAFDILFDTSQPGDPDLAHAVRDSGRVLLACMDKGQEQPEISLPEGVLLDAGAHVGHTRVPTGPDRPAIDRLAPVIAEGRRLMPSFGLEAVRMTRGQSGEPLRRVAGGWRAGDRLIPVDAEGTSMIRFFGPTGGAFPMLPFEKVVAATHDERAFFEKDTFRGKIVLVGDVTRINKDSQLTPLGRMPGVEIQANAIATLLAGRFIREATPGEEAGQLIVLGALAALLASVWRLRRAALFLVLLLPAYFVVNVLVFVQNDVFLHLVAPSATIVLTALGVLLERGLTEEQEKTRARGLLQRYVSPQIADHILQHPEVLGRAGERAVGTVLFADIRDFTALSERLPPEELVSRMNEYFQAMTEVIFRHDGTVASFVGDAMLALFGVPLPDPDHARRAVAASLEMQSALAELQKGWRAKGQPVFEMGIGINTGEMVVGDVGGRQLMSFTVYGLQVNIASRVEGLNRAFGSRNLITRATFEALADEVEVRGPMQANLKGMETRIEVFEVLGWRDGRKVDRTALAVAERSS